MKAKKNKKIKIKKPVRIKVRKPLWNALGHTWCSGC